MKLTFDSPHLSIQSLPEIELPSFTLITGVNGSGKTHLLQALTAGRIRTNIAENPKEDIRFFDWSTLVPNNTGEYHAAAVYNERDQLISWGAEARKQNRDPLIQWASRHDLIDKTPIDWPSIVRLTQTELAELIGDSDGAARAWQELQSMTNTGLNWIKQQARNNAPILSKLKDLEQKFGRRVIALGIRDFEDEPFGWGHVDVFQQSFAQLFMSYFEQKRLNMLRRLDEKEGRQTSVPPMSDEVFVERYGEPPWNFVNRVLLEARLDFAIDYPIEHSTTKFTPQLRKTTSGAELQFSELSSGERILMSFAFCLYYSLDSRQELRQPKLLLFDEIDAPLHPSMARQLIHTIQEQLVREQGVNVILTTHSPSTVAVSPEEAVYVMRSNESGLHKVGKRQAISVLTSEIPTLSIDFSGRRQVFVESRHDAARYEKLYRYLSPHLSSERSLAFIPVGRKKKKGEDNGGCDQVKQIVGQLVAAENDSVFGLVDWDLKNKSDDRIIVLAQDNRYAIENCLLDPLLVGALTVLTKRELGPQVGLASSKGYTDFKNLTPNECQAIIDGVERIILGLPKDSMFGERIEVEYLGGFSAQVSTEYLTMQGHQLEDLVMDKLPALKVYQNQGELLMKIIDPVVFELSKLVPMDIVRAFKTILEYGTFNSKNDSGITLTQ